MKNNSKNKCSYCNKNLGNKYTFGYGFPGIPRKYGCDRLTCKIIRKFRRKRNNNLRPFMKRLNELCNSWERLE